MKRSEISRRSQRIVASILTELISCDDFEDVAEIIARYFEAFKLECDPFTGLPCSTYDYYRSLAKYEEDVDILSD